MSCTYDPTLPTDRDWVRFLTGDTDVPDGCVLEDEELDATIAEEVALNGSGPWTKYCAAASALGAMASVGAAGTAGGSSVVEKQVGRLKLRRAEGTDARDAVQGAIDELRAKCAFYMTPRPRSFAVLGKRRCRRC